MCLHCSDDFQSRFSTFFHGLKNLAPIVNNLFKGIPFSHEDKIHENAQEPLLLGRRTKGNLTWCFHSFLQVFKRDFCRKSPIPTGRNDRLKPVSRAHYRTQFDISGIKQESFQCDCFDIQRAEIFQTPGVFIDSPGRGKAFSTMGNKASCL